MNFAICVFHSFTFCIICTVFTPILYPILLYTVPNLIFNIYKNRFAQVFRRLFLGIPSCGLFIEIGRIGFKQWSNVFFFRSFRSSNKMSMIHILYPSREILEARSFAQTWSLTNWEFAETPRSREMFTATYSSQVERGSQCSQFRKWFWNIILKKVGSVIDWFKLLGKC